MSTNPFPISRVRAPRLTEHPAVFEQSFPWAKYYDLLEERTTRMASGVVMMVHNGRTPAAGVENWVVYKADGSVLDTTGSLTSGLQEAINEAYTSGRCLRVYGGQIAITDAGPPPIGANVSLMTISTPILLRVGWMTDIEMSAVTFQSNLGYSDDMFWINSCDLTSIRMHRCQVILFAQTGSTNAAFRFHGTLDNGEGLAGISSSEFELPNFAILKASDFTNCTDGGSGIRFSTPNLGLSLPAGDGLISGNRIRIGEINGGKVPVLVDDPGTHNGFFWNHIEASGGIHTFGETGIQVGAAGTNSTLIHNNRWDVSIYGGNAGAIGVRSYGGNSRVGDFFMGNIDCGDYAFQWETTARKNKAIGVFAGAIADVNNLSGGATNVVY